MMCCAHIASSSVTSASIANYLHGLKQTQQLFHLIARQQAEWQWLVNRLIEASRSMWLAIAHLADDQRWLNKLARLLRY
jgi:hypothetical protein